ncbi:hypothetical protein C4K26_3035 [Pseudomonas chlororaphis]|nr:hypothetical protein C4K26_3035 [Pseudomonas chlororaphis]
MFGTLTSGRGHLDLSRPGTADNGSLTADSVASRAKPGPRALARGDRMQKCTASLHLSWVYWANLHCYDPSSFAREHTDKEQ